MAHLIPLGEREFKTLAKQYLNTLRAQADKQAPLPTLMQAQELLARACGHQSLHEAQAWWTNSSMIGTPDTQNETAQNLPLETGAYNRARAMQDETNVKRLREILLHSAHKLSLSAGAFSQNALLNLAGAEVNGHDHYTLYHLSQVMIEDGALVKRGGDITTPQWLDIVQDMQRMGQIRKAELGVPTLLVQHDLTLSEEQAVANACAGQVASVVETHNGAGKAIMVEQVCMAHKNAGYDVIISAPSWQDTHAMSYVVGQRAKVAIALDSLLNQMNSNYPAGRISFDKPTLVVVDDAGRVPAQMLAKLMSNAELDGSQLKVLLVATQLDPHSAAGIMKEVVGSTQVHRDRWQDQAIAGGPEKARRQKM